MNTDDTIIKVTYQTKKAIEAMYPIKISEQEILDIVDSQIKGVAFGLKKGISIKLPVIGRFLFIDRSGTLNKIYDLLKVRDFYSEIEFNQKILEGQIATIKRNKARWKREHTEKLTVIDIVKKPNISNGRIMYDKLSKLIEGKNGE